MPITARFDGSTHLIDAYLDKIENPDTLLQDLAETLVIEIGQQLGKGRGSGLMQEAITRVRGPFNTPEGRAIGIGDASLVGPRGAKAPRNTIKDFLEWYRDTQMGKREDKVETAPAKEVERPRMEHPVTGKLRQIVRIQRELTDVQSKVFDIQDALGKTRQRIVDLEGYMHGVSPTTKSYDKWSRELEGAMKRERKQELELTAARERMNDLSNRIYRLED